MVYYRKLPQGYTFGALQEEDSQQVSQNWPAYPWHTDETVKYVQHMTKLFPTVAIRDSSGALAAWSFMHTDGTIGNLYVMEEHRMKGLGSFTLAEIAKKLAEMYGYALSNIVWDNKESFKLHEKCGFKLASDLSYKMVLPVKKD